MANPFRPQQTEVPSAPEGCLAPLLRRLMVVCVVGFLLSVAVLGYIPFIGTANFGGQQTITTVGQSPQPLGRMLQLGLCYMITAVIGSLSWLFTSFVLGIHCKKVFLALWWIFLALMFLVNGDWFIVVFVTVGGSQDNTLVYTNAQPWFVDLAFRAIMVFVAFCLIIMIGKSIIGVLEGNRVASELQKAQEQENPFRHR